MVKCNITRFTGQSKNRTPSDANTVPTYSYLQTFVILTIYVKTCIEVI